MSLPDVHRSVGFWSGVALLVGTTIGGGIFRTPASIAAVMHDPRHILGLWVFFGLVSLCGALTLAELATLLPKTGGLYVYLRAAYGDAAAFVFGWLYMFAATPAGMGALAVFFGELLMAMLGIAPGDAPWGVPCAAAAAIIFLTAANIAGVRLGAAIQNIFAALKVGAILAIVGGAFFFGHGDVARWFTAPATTVADTGAGLAAATKSVMFTFNGWAYVGFVAGEIIQPERRLARIICVGTVAVIALYLSANLAYLYLMPLSAMPGTVIARAAMQLVAGPVGGTVITLCIIASLFGALNGALFTKSRVAYALARDGLGFPIFGRVHPTRATPYAAIAMQGAMCIALVFALRDPLQPLRLFDRLIAYFVLVEWFALIFAIGAVFVLRRRMPDAPRPYRTPGYPVVPLLFIGGTALGLSALLWSALSRGDFSPLVGLGIAAAGYPVYRVWCRLRSPASA
jgi:basic amino acid/polyamine antiporter, APA family